MFSIQYSTPHPHIQYEKSMEIISESDISLMTSRHTGSLLALTSLQGEENALVNRQRAEEFMKFMHLCVIKWVCEYAGEAKKGKRDWNFTCWSWSWWLSRTLVVRVHGMSPFLFTACPKFHSLRHRASQLVMHTKCFSENSYERRERADEEW